MTKTLPKSILSKPLFTPGEWSVTQDWNSTQFTRSFGVQAPTAEGPGWPTKSATGFYAMALPPPHGHDANSRAIQEANARLISAGPDLFAAAQAQEEASAASLSASEACPDGQTIHAHIAAQVESLFARAEKLRRNALSKALGL